MTTEFTPLADRVLVELVEAPTKSQGGIFIPEGTNSGNIVQGRVISRGNGALLSGGERSKPEVEAGDVIMFSKMAGLDIKIDHKPFKLVCERDILGKIRENEIAE